MEGEILLIMNVRIERWKKQESVWWEDRLGVVSHDQEQEITSTKKEELNDSEDPKTTFNPTVYLVICSLLSLITSAKIHLQSLRERERESFIFLTTHNLWSRLFLCSDWNPMFSVSADLFSLSLPLSFMLFLDSIIFYPEGMEREKEYFFLLTSSPESMIGFAVVPASSSSFFLTFPPQFSSTLKVPLSPISFISTLISVLFKHTEYNDLWDWRKKKKQLTQKNSISFLLFGSRFVSPSLPFGFSISFEQ